MKTAAVLALLPIASAFVAPMPKGASRGRSLKMAFENEAGVTAPLGYWVSETRVSACHRLVGLPGHARSLTAGLLRHVLQDPLGLSADGDVDKFNRYRANEIKHGRSRSPVNDQHLGSRPSLDVPSQPLNVQADVLCLIFWSCSCSAGHAPHPRDRPRPQGTVCASQRDVHEALLGFT
jgi:hypothetical protein